MKKKQADVKFGDPLNWGTKKNLEWAKKLPDTSRMGSVVDRFDLAKYQRAVYEFGRNK